MFCEITSRVYQNCTLTRLLPCEFSDYFFCSIPRGCIFMSCIYYHKNLNVKCSRFFFGLKRIEKWIKKLYSNEKAMKDIYIFYFTLMESMVQVINIQLSVAVLPYMVTSIFFLSGFSFTKIHESQDCRGRNGASTRFTDT